MKRLYYNYARISFHEEPFAILKEKKIALSKPESFNDPFDGQLNLKYALESELERAKNRSYGEYLQFMSSEIKVDDIINSTKNIGVFCMSKPKDSDGPDNILMWSHYAEKHKGFCIGFDFSNSELKKDIHEVHYSKDNPYSETLVQESLMEKSKDEFIRRLKRSGIINKSLEWKYEDEFRLIKDSCCKIPIEPKIIKEVVFGLKMGPCKKKELKTILLSSPDWDHVQIMQAEQDGTKLSLKIRPVNEKDYIKLS